MVKLSRKSDGGKIGKVTAIPPLCCSPPLPSSPFNNKSWEYGPAVALLGIDLGTSGFLLSAELDNKASQVLGFPLSYTPTAAAFVTAVSSGHAMCKVRLGQAQAALFNLFLTYFMKSLSSAELGQAEEGLSHSHTHVLMDVNKLRRLVQSFLLVIRSPQISNIKALAVYLLALGWAGGCASQSSSEEEPFLHWSVHRS